MNEKHHKRTAHAAALIRAGYAASAPQSATRDELTSLLRLRREHPEQFDRLGPMARMAVGFYDQTREPGGEDDDTAA